MDSCPVAVPLRLVRGLVGPTTFSTRFSPEIRSAQTPAKRAGDPAKHVACEKKQETRELAETRELLQPIVDLLSNVDNKHEGPYYLQHMFVNVSGLIELGVVELVEAVLGEAQDLLGGAVVAHQVLVGDSQARVWDLCMYVCIYI